MAPVKEAAPRRLLFLRFETARVRVPRLVAIPKVHEKLRAGFVGVTPGSTIQVRIRPSFQPELSSNTRQHGIVPINVEDGQATPLIRCD